MSSRGFRLPPTMPAAERIQFGVAVDIQTRCWNWLGVVDSKGYGHMRIGGVQQRVHRASYEAFVGPVPEGLQIDHLCRNRGCVNPGHLEPVSCAENQRRSPLANVSKTACPRGHDYAEHGRVYRGRRYCRICTSTKRQQAA